MNKVTNPFDWRKYTDEERAKRGETRNENNTARKRSISSTRAIERARIDAPTFGTVALNGKTATLIAMKPKKFKIHDSD